MNKNINCNNCGKQGHQGYQCKIPITSYGIIAFRTSSEYGIQYLMIRRKNSFGYIDFMRGKYTLNNLEHLQMIFDEMSVEEKNQLKQHTFDTLWRQMWGKSELNESESYSSNGEEMVSCKKFEALKTGIPIGPNGELVNIELLANHSTTQWSETEWEFPKGRRNFQEKELICALREFEEETGIPKKCIRIIENIIPFEEMFLGSNHKSYKHKYFLGYIDTANIDELNLNYYQQMEVSKIEWKTLDDCLLSIRPYNLEKKQLITNIHAILQEYRIY
jgi:8-oxo-dGTP pyrophosphatase MutT (NUDIX family)